MQEKTLEEFIDKWLNKYYVDTQDNDVCPGEYFSVFDIGEQGMTKENLLNSKEELLSFISSREEKAREEGHFQGYKERQEEEKDFIEDNYKKWKEEGRKEKQEVLTAMAFEAGIKEAKIELQEKIEAIITAYCDIDDYNVDKVMEDLSKLCKN